MRLQDPSYIKVLKYIGESVSIGKGSSISGSAIYNDVKIGDNVRIVDSVIMDATRIEDGGGAIREIQERRAAHDRGSSDIAESRPALIIIRFQDPLSLSAAQR